MRMPPLEHREYPSSDGRPMAETTLHRKVMSYVIQGLECRFAKVPGVWVGGNLLLYYEKGNPKKSVSPDVLLVQDIQKWNRNVYLLWEEKPPALVFEITSHSTRSEDTGKKKSLYERLGVSELVLFDPYGEYLDPRLQGYRLERGRYQPIALNSDGSLDVRTAGVTARPAGERLRLVDTRTGEKLLWIEELDAALQQEALARRAAEKLAEEIAARRDAEERAAAAEDRARILAEELARLRGEAKA